MNNTQYQREVRRTTPGNEFSNDTLALGALGLAGEAGEVADLIKKYLYHGHTLDYIELRKELGDVLWYAAYLCDALGTTLGEVMEHNAKKLRERYPHGFSAEASRNRTV